MHMRMIVIPVLAVLLAGPALAQDARRSAYDRLNARDFSEALRDLEMGELLGAYVQERSRQGGGEVSEDLLIVLADVKISQAQSLAETDLPGHDRLIDEAAGHLRELLQRKANPSTPEAKLDYFQVEFKLIDTQGRIGVLPYYRRVQYLMDAREDREIIVRRTDETDRLLKTLQRRVATLIEDTRVDAREWIVLGTEMQDFQLVLERQGAVIHLYRGMALWGETPQQQSDKAQNLTEVENKLRRFRRDFEDPWAPLMTGQAFREKGEYEPAEKLLQEALKEDDMAVKHDAAFELARNAIEQGKYDLADQRIREYREVALEAMGDSPGARFSADLLGALLTHHLFDIQARKAATPEDKARFQIGAERALIATADEHSAPEYLNIYMNIIGRKFRDRTDTENLGAFIMLCMARKKFNENTPASLAEAHRILQVALEREDEIALRVRPFVLNDLGRLMNWRRENLAAADYFARLAKEFPKHPLALPAARYAVKSYDGIILERIDQGKPIDPKLREGFVEVLTAGVQQWPEEEGIPTWYYYIGEQLRDLARTQGEEQRIAYLERAQEAFARVPADFAQYLRARHLGMQARAQLLELQPLDEAPRKAAAAALAEDLKAFSREALTAMAETEDKARARELAKWSSEAAFGAALLWNQQLGDSQRCLQDLQAIVANDAYKGMEVLRDVKEYEIRMLVESPGQTAEAIQKVQAFVTEYPAEAAIVLRLVAQRIGERIDRIRLDPARREELEQYRRSYLRFARELHALAQQKGWEPSKMYAANRTLADALTEAGLGQEALGYWNKCVAFDEGLQNEERKAIDTGFQARLQRVEASRENGEALLALSDEYLEDLVDLGLRPEIMPNVSAVRAAAEELRGLGEYDLSGKRNAQQTLAEALKPALEELQFETKKRTVGTDAANILGLARTYRLLKEYGEAMGRYKRMLRGIDRNKNPELYWAVELEYSEAILEGFGEDKDQMSILALRVRQLQIEDPAMGGHADRFTEIMGEATRRAKK